MTTRLPHRQRAIARVAVVASLSLTAACSISTGEGWVVGSLFAENCRSGNTLDRPDDQYDLEADFFAGDPLLDFSDSDSTRRSSVLVRVQSTSNRPEESDALLIRIHDLRSAAIAYAAEQPLEAQECFDLAGCPSASTIGGQLRPLVLRSQLNLYTTCPDSKTALVASTQTFSTADLGAGGSCEIKSQLAPPAGCPSLDEAARARLDALCDGAFSDRSRGSVITEVLGRDSACMYLCRLGGARRGQSAEQLRDFSFDYGDRIGAVFSFNLVDSRALRLGTCATVRGHVYGMFNFEMNRNRAAQPFP